MSEKYHSHAVGRHIIPFPLLFKETDKVGKTISAIRSAIGLWPNIEQVFVVNDDKKLIGTIEFSKLVRTGREKVLKEILNRKFKSVTDHSPQDIVARIAVKDGLETIPVTDSETHFLGIVDAGEIFKILHEEHIEKLMHFSGILASEDFLTSRNTSFLKNLKSRLPWLIVGLFGGVGAAHIIGSFEKTLESQLILATFIPLIVYMADAIGTQTETIFVRDLAIDAELNLMKFLKKEITIGLSIAFVCGALISSYSFLRFGSAYLGMVLGLSLFSATLIAVTVGTLIPWLINKTKYDPALGTGPLTTVIQDVASVTVYFLIAAALL